MTKLTTEITIDELQYRIHAHENDLTQMWTADYFLSVQKELLALKQATKNPVAYRNKFTGQFFTLEQQPDAVTDTAVYEPVFLAAPVLPKQPELVENLKKVMNSWLAMEPKLAFQPEFTDVMMLLDAEAAPAQPAMPVQEIVGWVFEDELPKNYPYDAMFVHSKVDVVRMFPVFAPSSAQPVSEPKLPEGWKLVPLEPTAEIIQSGIAAHYDRQQFQIHDRPAPGPMECAYRAMLAAAPARESE